jgi:protein gp37
VSAAVWKFPLAFPTLDQEGVTMPAGAKVLHVGMQDDVITVLTKRPQRMAHLLLRWRNAGWMWRRSDLMWCGPPHVAPLPNVHLLTSIESDPFTFRARHLVAAPGAVHGLSLEPLLGPLPSLDLTGIDWVIVGGESGPGARPMHPDWVRDIRDRCVAAGVPFFFKQWGGWQPVEWGSGEWTAGGRFLEPSGGWRSWRPGDVPAAPSERCQFVQLVGKKAAGRVLDGRTWDEMPSRAA